MLCRNSRNTQSLVTELLLAWAAWKGTKMEAGDLRSWIRNKDGWWAAWRGKESVQMAGRQSICTRHCKSHTLALCVKLSGNRQAWRLVCTHTICCRVKKLGSEAAFISSSLWESHCCTGLVFPLHSLHSTHDAFITPISRNTLIPILVRIYLYSLLLMQKNGILCDMTSSVGCHANKQMTGNDRDLDLM